MHGLLKPLKFFIWFVVYPQMCLSNKRGRFLFNNRVVDMFNVKINELNSIWTFEINSDLNLKKIQI